MFFSPPFKKWVNPISGNTCVLPGYYMSVMSTIITLACSERASSGSEC